MGIDLNALWHARTWRKLLNLIDHLPLNSFFNESRSEDEELAAIVAEQPLVAHKERLSQWSPERELLAAVFDRLGNIISVLISVNSKGAPPKIEPFPRPISAFQIARERLDTERYRAFLKRMEGPNL